MSEKGGFLVLSASVDLTQALWSNTDKPGYFHLAVIPADLTLACLSGVLLRRETEA